MPIVHATTPMLRRRINYQMRRRGVGSLASDCAAGDATACQQYYATQYNVAPSVVAASTSAESPLVANESAMAATAMYAPPVYKCDVCTGLSTDPNVYLGDRDKYIQQLDALTAINQANDENGRRYANYQQAYSNWLQNGQQGPQPSPPQYITPASITVSSNISGLISTAPAGTPIPQSGYDVSGGSAFFGAFGTTPMPAPAPTTLLSSAQPAASTTASRSAPSPSGGGIVPARGTTTPSIFDRLKAAVTGEAATGGSDQTAASADLGVPAAASGNWFDGIPNWAVLAGAGVAAYLVFRGRR
jgi:hypothetical protein